MHARTHTHIPHNHAHNTQHAHTVHNAEGTTTKQTKINTHIPSSSNVASILNIKVTHSVYTQAESVVLITELQFDSGTHSQFHQN